MNNFIKNLMGKTLEQTRKVIKTSFFYSMSNFASYGIREGNLSACLYQYGFTSNKIEKTFLLFFTEGKLSLITEKTF